MEVHEITNYPKELHKKVTLMQHFRSYLETHEDSEDGNASSYLPPHLAFLLRSTLGMAEIRACR
jgi:hypothetical protein